MRVLLTGGAGRLGINICKAFLQDGFQVRILDLDTPRNRKSVRELDGRVEVLWGDITKPDSVREALRDVDTVVHMAAILPPVADKKPKLAAKVNVDGTKMLVDMIRETGRHVPFVFTSSAAAFGPTPDATEPLCPDKHHPCPKGAYGETKLKAETLVEDNPLEPVIVPVNHACFWPHHLVPLVYLCAVLVLEARVLAYGLWED